MVESIAWRPLRVSSSQLHQTQTRSLTHSLTHSPTHSRTHSLTHSLSLVTRLQGSLFHSLTRSLFHSLTRSLTRRAHELTNSPQLTEHTQSFTHSRIHRAHPQCSLTAVLTLASDIFELPGASVKGLTHKVRGCGSVLCHWTFKHTKKKKEEAPGIQRGQVQCARREAAPLW